MQDIETCNPTCTHLPGTDELWAQTKN